MEMRKICRALFWAVAITGIATPAHAAITQYTDLNSFDTASTGLTSITFEGTNSANGGASGYTIYNPNLVQSGVTFTDLQNLYAVTSGIGPAHPGTILGLAGNAVATAQFPSNITAVALQVYGGDGAGSTATFQILTSDGGSFSTTTAPYNPASSAPYYGFTESTPGVTISEISFNPNGSPAGNYSPYIDNVSFGTALVPEPKSLSLIALGCIGLLAGNRRRPRIV